MADKDAVERVLDVIAPKEFGKRTPIFEWAHEETPDDNELWQLAERIVDAVESGNDG